MRIKCINARWRDGIKDPELTTGKFYPVLTSDLLVMGSEPQYTLIGDSMNEITRPKHIFRPMPNRMTFRARMVRKNGKAKMLVAGMIKKGVRK